MHNLLSCTTLYNGIFQHITEFQFFSRSAKTRWEKFANEAGLKLKLGAELKGRTEQISARPDSVKEQIAYKFDEAALGLPGGPSIETNLCEAKITTQASHPRDDCLRSLLLFDYARLRIQYIAVAIYISWKPSNKETRNRTAREREEKL
jgi:hypothetical protein